MYSILSSLLEMTRKKDQIFFSFEHFEKKRTILGVLKKTFYSFFLSIMNTPTLLSSAERKALTPQLSPRLQERIASQQERLASTLAGGSEEISAYAEQIVEGLAPKAEYPDLFVTSLLQLKPHLERLYQEKSQLKSEDLPHIVPMLHQIIDQLSTLMREQGALRNHFAFLLQEIQMGAKKLLGHLPLMPEYSAQAVAF